MSKPLSVAEVADRLGVSQSLVYSLVQERRLKALRLGRRGKRGKILVQEDSLEAFLQATREDLADD